jgi:hypothetical protein
MLKDEIEKKNSSLKKYHEQKITTKKTRIKFDIKTK